MWEWAKGKKTYAALLMGAAVVLFNHFIAPIPGLALDPAQWQADLYSMLVAGTVRHGIGSGK